ncbi:SDR family oxidoreductase [Pseudovibrio sp. Tun.PSC04-5.I4]|uniref:SDR family oxidoreductase n=1 Tax=Pseudovibrio sp. Tun.PSC04-5.I4 TaxID=1798213 RepID=UPI00088BB299|nr:SDR family oxidoreductase [Pseudovibrio sp. Tun.PSC04-5.I4]SDR14200.1 UDP-glucose 4-epimerase [Pseudovibrio sp. Tun.PSC04-5.I4]
MSKLLITGAAGGVGQAFLRQLEHSDLQVVATDVRRPDFMPAGATYQKLDVTTDRVFSLIAEEKPDVIVHLASIVTPPANSTRDLEYLVDVEGTKAVLDASIRHGVKRLVVTSSGAAYGYHADNPVPLREADATRGNQEFAYAYHKRLVEEMLADARKDAPQLEQVLLRVGTVLGAGMDNQITSLFHKARLLGVVGSDSPWVFIWTQDLARILLRAVAEAPAGIYNVAGDGAVSVHQLGEILGKPVIKLPAWMLKLILGIAKTLKLSRYGPEQVRFLQYRPVLSNERLKTEFGYIPEKTSAEVFEHWRLSVGL